jgi:hypothetical protein
MKQLLIDMAKVKTAKVELAVDWYAQWVAEHIPQMLEVLGGGPLAAMAKAASPPQRQQMIAGLNRIVDCAAKMKATIAEAGN